MLPSLHAQANSDEAWGPADIVNGERNTILVAVESQETERNVTLKSIAGSLHNAQTNKLIKNVRESSMS